MNLKIASNLQLPLSMVTESIAVLAVKRAGKSNVAKRIVEELHAAHQQFVVVDPKGDWWGLRSSADGKSAGIPVAIFGGEHGDIPLEASGGEIVARAVVEQCMNIVLDLSDFRKHQVSTFMAAFLETIYRLKNKDEYRTPMMLVVDEADAIAPQRVMKGENQERMLGAAEDIVRRGGQRGIGITLVSQRAAVLNKNVLTQCGVLILLRTVGPQDINAVDEWIDKHGEREKRNVVLAEIAKLPTGTAWVWSPAWPTVDGIFRRVEFPIASTFDSGRTPVSGERVVRPKLLADVDLEQIRLDMSDTIERAAQNNPNELKKTIAELRKIIAKKPEHVKELRLHLKDIERITKTWQKFRDEASAFMRAFQASDPWEQPASKRTNVEEAKSVIASSIPVSLRTLNAPPPKGKLIYDGLPAGEKAILTAAAQHGQNGVTRSQLITLTGYRRSTRDAYIQRLKEKGFVSVQGQIVLATSAGVKALGPSFEPLPTGPALQNYWMNRLPHGEKLILSQLITEFPASVPRATIDSAFNFKRSTRDAYLMRLAARKLVENVGGGCVRASEDLMR